MRLWRWRRCRTICASSLPLGTNTLCLWDLESGAKLRSFKGHSDKVEAVAIFPDGKRALSGSQDKTLRLWVFQRRRT